MSEIATLRPIRISRSDAWRGAFITKAGGRCHYCNRGGSLDCGPDGRPWHIDHMEPLALGGPDTEENLTLACKRCNMAKGAQPYERFRALARASFWVDDEGSISEAELETLLYYWQRTITISVSSRRDLVQYGWHWRVGDDGSSIILATDYREPSNDRRIFRSYYAEMDDDAATFAVEAHRWMPRLLAEIRQLRGRVAELEEAA